MLRGTKVYAVFQEDEIVIAMSPNPPLEPVPDVPLIGDRKPKVKKSKEPEVEEMVALSREYARLLNDNQQKTQELAKLSKSLEESNRVLTELIKVTDPPKVKGPDKKTELVNKCRNKRPKEGEC